MSLALILRKGGSKCVQLKEKEITMGDPVQLRDVIIIDLNQNDLFDPNIDQVTDVSGQTLTPAEEAKRLQEILKELQVNTWKGILLSQAEIYLINMREAEKMADMGGVVFTESYLDEAKKAAQALPIQYNLKREKEIQLIALKNGEIESLKEARKMANAGKDIGSIKKLLTNAKNFSEKLKKNKQNSIYRKATAEKTLWLAYKNGIPRLKKDVEKSAARGNIIATRYIIQEIITYAKEANKKYDGNTRLKLNFTFPQSKINQLMYDAYTYGIPKYYPIAERLAKRGQTIRVRRILNKIETLINEGTKWWGISITLDKTRVDNILDEALIKGIEDNLKLATRKARRGIFSSAEKWVNEAEKYTKEWNDNFSGQNKLIFDIARADAILACAKKLAPCPKRGEYPVTKRP